MMTRKVYLLCYPVEAMGWAVFEGSVHAMRREAAHKHGPRRQRERSEVSASRGGKREREETERRQDSEEKQP